MFSKEMERSVRTGLETAKAVASARDVGFHPDPIPDSSALSVASLAPTPMAQGSHSSGPIQTESLEAETTEDADFVDRSRWILGCIPVASDRRTGSILGYLGVPLTASSLDF